MADLKSRTAKLALENPELRSELLPLLREAALRIDDRTIDAIARMTGHNDHNGALLTLAQALGAKQSYQLMEHIIAISDIMGHNPLTSFRYSAVYKPLMELAKRKLDPDSYQRIHDSF